MALNYNSPHCNGKSVDILKMDCTDERLRDIGISGKAGNVCMA